MQKSIVEYSRSCLAIYSGENKILVDPRRRVPCDFVFFSHAHSDHLCRAYSGTHLALESKILTSKETSIIASARGLLLRETVEEYDGFRLIDTGHILGSRGLLIEGRLFYTGDISTRRRGFLKSARMPEVQTLIIESTYGQPKYVFPDTEEVIHRTNKIISEMFDQGIPVVLMGYSVGKAQLLTALFGHWEPIYVHDSVHEINLAYRKLGVVLKDAITASIAEQQGLLRRTRPWVMISPLMHSRNSFVRLLREKYNAVCIGFSGWAVSNKYRAMMGLDYAMPMSDHCDYPELIECVKKSGANKIYTFHGFSQEFANSLENLGFDAEPLIGHGVTRKQRLDNTYSKNSLDVYF
jgi:putative mRNA 3-end processing factor